MMDDKFILNKDTYILLSIDSNETFIKKYLIKVPSNI
jgi:hypothetical protein